MVLENNNEASSISNQSVTLTQITFFSTQIATTAISFQKHSTLLSFIHLGTTKARRHIHVCCTHLLPTKLLDIPKMSQSVYQSFRSWLMLIVHIYIYIN